MIFLLAFYDITCRKDLISTSHIYFCYLNGNSLCWFCFLGITRMELLLDNATVQIYILHTSGHIQVIQDRVFNLVAGGKRKVINR